ncbi:MAG: HNH endonuclease [Deltaproteobacteria bacterium]|nr:HNH endonuclease [Deltaproteobacteria bacterium]
MLCEGDDCRRSPQEIDQAILELAGRQGALDEELGRWLLLAHRARLHRNFGMASFAEYLERRLGYGPRIAKDKAIVAEALEQLPAIRAALTSGRRSWSATRELVRVATPNTEADWLRASEAKTVREVERMVSGRRMGDRPDAERDPLLELHRAVFTLTSNQRAMVEDAKIRVRRMIGPHATDGQVLAYLCESFLGRAQAPDDQPSYQVAVTICAHCESTFRAADGEVLEVAPEVHDCAMCDGELVGLVPTPVESPHVGRALSLSTSSRMSASPDVGQAESPRFSQSSSEPLRLGQARSRSFPERMNVSPHVGQAADPLPHLRLRQTTHVGQAGAPIAVGLRALIKNEGLGAVCREASRALGFSLKTVSTPLRRACLARDQHRCTVPGCQNNLFIDLHHLKKVRDGGAHTFENLTTLCSAHHRQHHAGYLGIEGTPSTGLVFRTARGTLYAERPGCAAA